MYRARRRASTRPSTRAARRVEARRAATRSAASERDATRDGGRERDGGDDDGARGRGRAQGQGARDGARRARRRRRRGAIALTSRVAHRSSINHRKDDADDARRRRFDARDARGLTIRRVLFATRDAQFIEDVAAHVGERDVDEVMEAMRARYGRYKRLEAELQQARIRLSTQLPDVRRSLDAIEALCEKRDRGDASGTTVKYQLTEATFADATVETPESAYLWLGANVMLEYTLDEARELLGANAAACESGLEANARDLAVLKDNATVMEVNMARVYNFDVKRQRERERQAAAK